MPDLPSIDPPLTEQVIEIDATPNEDYPLRILRTYRHRASTHWKVSGLPPERTLIYDLMNEQQDQRAEILDKTIQILERIRGKNSDDNQQRTPE